MRPVADGIAWSVGRSVCHDREPCKNRWTDRYVVWVVDSGVDSGKHVLDGVHIGITWRIRLNRRRRRCGLLSNHF